MTLSGTATASDGGMMPGQSPVLRIIVENLYYPVSLEVLHQVTKTSFMWWGFPTKLYWLWFSSIHVFFSSPHIDLLKIWDGSEDYNIHQEQPVSGLAAILRCNERASLQTGQYQTSLTVLCELESEGLLWIILAQLYCSSYRDNQFSYGHFSTTLPHDHSPLFKASL